MNTILTDDERSAAIRAALDASDGETVLHSIFCREIEAAVLAKLREQEPVAVVRSNGIEIRGEYSELIGSNLYAYRVPSDAEMYSSEFGFEGCYVFSAANRTNAAQQPAVVQVPQADWAADAREWGSALNDAGWEFDEAYRRHMGEPVSAKLFNTCKTIIRDVILRYAEKVSAAAPEAPAQADHTKLLRMIAQRAKCFPSYPLGYHIPEVFAAIGEEPPQPEAPARPSACRLTECEGRAMCPTCTVLAAPEAPALPAEVREALKVAREALAGFIAITSDSRGVAGYHLSGDTAEWDVFDEVDAAVAALARIDALGGGE